MKAIVQTSYGPASEVLELRDDVEIPVPRDDEVLVRVKASCMHPDVWHVVTGLPYVVRLMGPGFPKPKTLIPGTDAAGVVESVGHNAKRLAPGDEVFGEVVAGFQWKNGGTYAEYVAAPEGEMVLKPENVTFEEAAAVPTTGLIALRNLREGGKLAAGQNVLVNGAGGGVGTFAVQIAKAYDGRVTAVDHESKLAMLREIGADHVIDYEKEKALGDGERYDLVFDVASNLRLSDVRQVLTENGIYVRIGHEHFDEQRHRLFGHLPSFFALALRAGFDRHLPDLDFSRGNADRMETLRELAAAGKVRPVVDRTFPLSEVVEAMRHMTEERVRGRVVITVES